MVVDSLLPPACIEQQKLIAKVQAHLIRISELSRATADAVGRRDEEVVKSLDREAEEELGKKERALGALRQHRAEHGC